MQAIILAGGFGKRLHPLVSDRPKPMASIGGRPHLAWLLEFMQGQGVTEAVLSLHHMHSTVRNYFGERVGNMRLQYIIEDQPLGTGGAMRHALQVLRPTAPVLALNGDSLVMLDYRRLMALHEWAGRRLTMVTHHVADCRRYGTLEMDGNRIERFDINGHAGPGDINVGVYAISPKLFDPFLLPNAFSFERDFLAVHTPALQPGCFNNVEYFIDIGVPEDYQKAQREIPALLSAKVAA